LRSGTAGTAQTVGSGFTGQVNSELDKAQITEDKITAAVEL